MGQTNQPVGEMQPLSLPNPALSLSSHPSKPQLAIGTTTELVLAEAPSRQPGKVLCTHPLPSVHATSFFNDDVIASSGNRVYQYRSEKPIPICTVPSTGDLSITALAPHDRHSILVGDSDGGVHLVDTRSRAVASTLQQGDYITALEVVHHLGTSAVLSSSGDGTLCAYDIRLPNPRVKLMYATDSYNDDLLSLAILPRYAVAGTLSGALNVYDLRFLDASRDDDARVDRFFGHPECVNAVLEWDDVVLTASSDGYVRVVDVVARKLLGILEYDMQRDSKRSKEAWPVEGMVHVRGTPNPVFALQGHDDVLRFCDGAALIDDDDDDDAEGSRLGAGGDEDMGKKKKKRRKGIDNTSGFFDDL